MSRQKKTRSPVIHTVRLLGLVLTILVGSEYYLSSALLAQVPRSTKNALPEKIPTVEDRKWAGSFVQTPMRVVHKMLEVARVTRADKVFDLGSGDGRIVITAAQRFGAEAVGIELDEELVKHSSASIARKSLQTKAKILHGDIFEADLSSATVVTIYLVESVNARLRPLLEKQLSPGTRVVVHDFRIPGWKPQQVVTVISDMGVPHTIYLYVRAPNVSRVVSVRSTR